MPDPSRLPEECTLESWMRARFRPSGVVVFPTLESYFRVKRRLEMLARLSNFSSSPA